MSGQFLDNALAGLGLFDLYRSGRCVPFVSIDTLYDDYWVNLPSVGQFIWTLYLCVNKRQEMSGGDHSRR